MSTSPHRRPSVRLLRSWHISCSTDSSSLRSSGRQIWRRTASQKPRLILLVSSYLLDFITQQSKVGMTRKEIEKRRRRAVTKSKEEDMEDNNSGKEGKGGVDRNQFRPTCYSFMMWLCWSEQNRMWALFIKENVKNAFDKKEEWE